MLLHQQFSEYPRHIQSLPVHLPTLIISNASLIIPSPMKGFSLIFSPFDINYQDISLIFSISEVFLSLEDDIHQTTCIGSANKQCYCKNHFIRALGLALHHGTTPPKQ